MLLYCSLTKCFLVTELFMTCKALYTCYKKLIRDKRGWTTRTLLLKVLLLTLSRQAIRIFERVLFLPILNYLKFAKLICLETVSLLRFGFLLFRFILNYLLKIKTFFSSSVNKNLQLTTKCFKFAALWTKYIEPLTSLHIQMVNMFGWASFLPRTDAWS